MLKQKRPLFLEWEIHLDVMLERQKRRFGVEIEVGPPRIAYRETIKGRAKAQGKYKKQSGGRGQYGDCWLELEPLPRGKGFQFIDKIVGGVIPKIFLLWKKESEKQWQVELLPDIR